MFLIFYFTPIITNTFLNMENAENEENNTTNHVTPPPLPTTVELCTLCAHYVFAYIFHLDKV